MAVVPSSSRAAFARFVRRAVDEAKDQRQWSVTRLAEETGVGRSTLFRWLAAEWRDYPELEKVRAFCTALDIPVSAAFRALGLQQSPAGAPMSGPATPAPAGWLAEGEPGTGIDAEVDRDVRIILRRLADPAVTAEEKAAIREGLQRLARHPGRLAS